MLRSKTFTAIFVGIFVTATLGIASAETPSTRAIYATPAEVVAAAQKATAEKDMAASLDCYSPAGHDALAKFILWAVASTPTTVPASQPANPERAEFEAKYGLDRRERKAGESTEQFATRLMEGLPDRRAFLVDFMTRQQTHQAKRPPATRPSEPLELQDVQIDASGTNATAKLLRKSRDGGTMSQNVKFEKIDGSWRIATVMMY